MNGTDGEKLIAALSKTVDELMRTAARQPVRVSVRVGDAAIEAEWPTAGGGPAEEEPKETQAAPEEGTTVNASLVGTFYRASEPGAPPFVDVGDVVQAGQQIAIIEAMKLMIPVEADRSGTLLDVLVGDGESVEFDQPLFALAVEESA
ncbi:acetyl-CoA carboxylase biotin carboxyl carrier protein [Spinactinospora alkalitolerans]|uniref:Biotin carboxyl carrier protein of acetyl-CoA carboxylase n=1 Tax=Spinactinospora alkalitolerans TaxID=687207 RepID=A0A852TN97_9ACTN|nr:biotin/lipoyl-containing protein [Spinactinospora alkalitolerans]NYE45408.1 acetyl-CoA carboxylase biotin carboxyl carrier protein [Spinactinospora alkalitolerans]